MTFNEYVETVKREIKDYLPEEYKDVNPEINKVRKNNGMELTGLTLRGESNICPNIYLDSFYDLYQDGMKTSDTMSKISEIFQREIKRSPQFNLEDFTYNNMKDNLYYTVIHAEKNEKLLQDIPHQRREDLAIVYRMHLNVSEEGIGSILLNNAHLKLWGVDQGEVHTQAVMNMPKILPPTFENMNNIIAEMMGADIEEFEEMTGENIMWVLSNDKKMQGAAYIFDEEVMSSIAEKLGGDFIVLPSSLHEVIILKEEENMDLEYIHGMVSEVNESQVEPDEVLSDAIYRYSSKDNKLSLIEEFEQSQDMEMKM
ncbi:DUF5688 family protein [Proteiniborus sp. MB09-C3]|uniref:DUF5688 family protein n=1 Tax=Proteiniborus sp. MB09-C3 TaxID=3050072 RepID=UPI00255700B5|nr:DUF5688 family protein [Proteiniborus sp. MB09-C3]WIV13594.1 DUF5688 family protein [Proteiniborus sp. MB09-C3]